MLDETIGCLVTFFLIVGVTWAALTGIIWFLSYAWPFIVLGVVIAAIVYVTYRVNRLSAEELAKQEINEQVKAAQERLEQARNETQRSMKSLAEQYQLDPRKPGLDRRRKS